MKTTKNYIGKKAQMEMLGIAVVVVFLALGIYFVVQFNLNEPTESKNVYTQSELAYNTITAIITTNAADCPYWDLATLLIDCADYLDSGGQLVCKEENGHENKSCEYLNYTVRHIMNQSLDVWNKNYLLNVTTVNGLRLEQVYSLSHGNCIGEKRASEYFLRTNVKGTMLIKLEMCG